MNALEKRHDQDGRPLLVTKNYVPRESFSIQQVTPPVTHGEGPYWDFETQKLYWVDTFNATIYRWNYVTDDISSYKLDGHDSVGVIIPVAKQKNTFLVAADRKLYKFIWNENDSELEYISIVDKDKPNNQFNDGKADYKGRLWIGTLTRNEDLSVAPKGGSLFRLEGKNLEIFSEQISHTTISNGLGWSPDRKIFYYIDSITREIVKYDYDEETGDISDKEIILDLSDYPDIEGIPDGMTVDKKGNLWVALFGGHHLLHVNPYKHSLIRKVKMPVKYITSVCFGGPHMDVLYVTTSKLHVHDTELPETPLAGSVFAIKNLGVGGPYPDKVRLC